MTDTEIRELLQSHLATVEPPLKLSSDEIARAGRRSRRVRAGVFGGVAMVAVAAVGGAVALLALDEPEQQSRVATDPGPNLQETIEEVATQVFTPYVGALPAPTFTSTDRDGNTVPLDHPGLAGVGALYELPGGHDLSLGVNAAGGMEDLCETWASPRVAVECEVTTLPDGNTVMTAILAFGPPSGGAPLPTLLTAAERAEADPASLTWSRGVTVIAPDGEISGGYELVPAPSYAAAKSAWQVPVDALVAAATDPGLTGYEFE